MAPGPHPCAGTTVTGNQCGLVVQAHKRYCAIHQRQQFATAASPERDDDVVHAEDIIQPQNLSGSCMYYVYTAAGKRRHSADGFYEWRHHNRKIMLYNEEKELVADDFVQEPRVGGELNVGQWKVSVESLDRNPLSPNLVQPKHIQRTRLDLSQAIKTRFPRFKEVLAKREEEVRRADQAVITAHNRRDQAASKMERAVFLAEHTDTTITELEQLQERMAVLKQVQVQQQEEFVLIIEEDDGEDYNDDRIDEHVQNEGYRNVATRTQYHLQHKGNPRQSKNQPARPQSRLNDNRVTLEASGSSHIPRTLLQHIDPRAGPQLSRSHGLDIFLFPGYQATRQQPTWQAAARRPPAANEEDR